MIQIPQSTSFVVVFKAYLSSDHVSEATSKSIAITISKAGGAFGNPSAGATTAAEITSGWYKFTLSTTDTDTLGIIAIRGAVATIDDYGDRFCVVSASTGGLTNLDAAVTSRMATYSQPSGFLAATFPGGTVANTTNITAGTIATVSGNVAGSVGSVTGLTASNLDTTVSSRMATYTQPTGFLAATFPGAVASTTNITAGTITTVSAVTGLTASNLDTTVSSRLAATGYTVPPTANANADALLDRTDAVETGLTPRQAIRLVASTTGAKISGGGTTTETFRNAVADSKNRVVATVDTSGNRSAITYDLT